MTCKTILKNGKPVGIVCYASDRWPTVYQWGDFDEKNGAPWMSAVVWPDRFQLSFGPWSTPEMRRPREMRARLDDIIYDYRWWLAAWIKP